MSVCIGADVEIREYYTAREQALLTPEIRARHDRCIERIQEKLFQRHGPNDYFLCAGSLRVQGPIAATRDGDEPMLGGVSYDIEAVLANTRVELSIQHDQASRFTVFLIVHDSINGACYVRFAAGSHFRDVDTCALRCVNAYRGEGSLTAPIGHFENGSR